MRTKLTKTMDKILITSTMCLLIAGAVNSQANPLSSPNLKQMQRINQLAKQSRKKGAQLSAASQKLLNTQYKLNNALETISTNNITIKSLTKTNDTLKQQKADLEAQMLKNQNDTNNNYRDEVHKYQTVTNQSMSDTLAQFQASMQKLQNTNNDLNTQLVSTKKALEGANHQITMDKETLQSVNTIVSILTAQKKSLEANLEQTLKETTEAYKKQIAGINTKSQQQIDKYRDSYEALKATNNETLETAKEEFSNKINIEKKLYHKKITALIDKVNNYQHALNTATADITKNANLIDTTVAKLYDAYKYIPAPSLKKSGMGKIMKDIGLSSSDTSWDAVSKEVANLKDNLNSVRSVSIRLKQENLNNKTILKKDDENNGNILGLF